ncbi:MAG: hypothetical protein GY778_30740 [bacterium]|nr:hypothetical protein [bacterium]
MKKKSALGLAIRLGLPVILLATAGYVYLERSKVRVGVDELTLIPRLAGGFVGLGTCRDKPSVLVLSHRSLDDVAIHADTDAILRRATLTVESDGRPHRYTLHSPGIVLISKTAAVNVIPVDWDASFFRVVLQLIDCGPEEHTSTADHPLCGRPFDELMQYLADNHADRIPPEMVAFVANAEER